MTKKISRIIAVIMLIIAVCFLSFALTHPEASFPWSNSVTYIIYIIYVVIMIVFFAAPFKK